MVPCYSGVHEFIVAVAFVSRPLEAFVECAALRYCDTAKPWLFWIPRPEDMAQ